MLTPGGLHLRRVEAYAVIPDLDHVVVGLPVGRHPHHPRLPDSDPVADGVLHQGLHREGGKVKVRVPDVVLHLDGGKAQHLDLGVNLGMLQFLLEGDQLGLVQGVQILPQVGAEGGDGVKGLLRVGEAQALDGHQGVVEEVGLDLAHHNADALLGHQVPLVLPDKLQVKPDIIEYTAAHHGNGQEGDRGGPAPQQGVRQGCHGHQQGVADGKP